MDNNYLEILTEASNEWWNTSSNITTLQGKQHKIRGEHTQDSLKDILIMYDAARKANCKSRWMYDFPRRLAYEIGGTSGIRCGLYSKNTYSDKPTIDDHIFGARLSGEQVLKAFKEWDYNIDHIITKWLPQNIWLFCSATISKEEHNILTKNAHSKNQKLHFIHYKECNIELVHKGTNFKNSKKLLVVSGKAEHNMKTWFNFENIK